MRASEVTIERPTQSANISPAVGPDAPVMEILRTTRAIRQLAPDPLPRELIRTVIEAATWAPSGGNSQPTNYLVVTDRAKLASLADLWGRVIDDFQAMAESAGIEVPDDASHRRTAEATRYMRDHFAEVPALVVICDGPTWCRPARGPLATLWTMVRRNGLAATLRIARAKSPVARSEAASYYPAAQNLLIAARAHGLGACFTCWHLLAEDEFKRVLGIPPEVRTWAIIPIGYPLRPFGPVNRRPVDEVVHWNTW